MSENRYLEDKTLDEGYRDEGLVNAKNLIIGSAAIAGSILAYKSGALKPIVKNAYESMANKKPTVSAAFNDLRKWLKSDGAAPDKSIFRMGVKGTVKEFAGVDKTSAKKAAKSIVKGDYATVKDSLKEFYKLNKDNAKDILKQTREDIGDYSKRFDKTLDRLMRDSSKYHVQNSYHNTDILKNIRDMNNAVNGYSDNMIEGKKVMKSKMTDALFSKFTLSKEQAAKSMKRKGLKKATLEDMFDIKVDKSGKIVLSEKTKYSFYGKDRDMDSAKKEIEKILNSKTYTNDGIFLTKNGKPIMMHEKHKNFKDLIIDNSIYVDEKGKFIDLRSSKKSNQEFFRNMATEWQIPIIGVNPLRMFGVDKIGKRQVHFGTISENTVAPFLTGVKGNAKENTIKNLKDKVDVLRGVREGVTIIDGDVYRMNSAGTGIVKMDYKSKKKLVHVPKSMDAGTNALTPNENALRKMAGLSQRKFEDYTKEDGWKYYMGKLGKFFDVGRQERFFVKDKFDSLSDYSNPDSYLEKVISKISPKNYKSSEKVRTFSGLSDQFSNGAKKDSFFVINDSKKLSDIKASNFNLNTIKEYVTQYGASFDRNFENVNKRTGNLYFMLERMNQTISSVGLGLSLESTTSSFDTVKNLLLKRMLPIYGVYKGIDMLNVFGEDDTENGTKPSTLNQKFMKAVVNTDVGLHKFSESLGMPKFIDSISELTPGSDMLEEFPGIKMLNLGETSDEREEYWKNGYDPVRKGRYWSMNSTPFVGGKIQYWKPNAYRAAMADAKYSDSQYGSRKERMANILDPYHYDRKHYKDRPYLMSSAAFENVPLVGPVLSSTVGRVIKPPKKMHEEYWNEDGSVKSRQQLRIERQENLGNIMSLKEISQESSNIHKEAYLRDTNTIKRVFNFGNSDLKNQYYSDDSYASGIANGIRQEGKYMAMFRTNSGAMRAVDLGPEGNSAKYKINKQGYTLGNIMGTNENTNITGSEIINSEMIKDAKFADPTDPYSLSNTLANQYVNSANVAGIYGFGATGFVTGNPNSGKTVIETSGYSRSFNKEFWDKDLGGAGGDISEIFRRFIQKRRSDQHYYNPIRNTMPDWMPGENGFIDFQHGDPYVKIQRGEERLPGEGFERLHGIDMNELLKMKVGSSTLGKTKDEMIKHFLQQDKITDPILQDIVDTGTETHEKIEKEMLRAGLAIDAEQEVRDDENGIIGFYDLKIHDRTSKSGEAIVDIKTIGSKGFEQIKSAKAPKDLHQRQVNWYLHHTNKKNKGYVMYVNRDNPDEKYTIGFDYDKDMYESTMATLNEARNDVKTMLNNGDISRADLYKPIDRFKILADVAPYSDEFRAMNKQMSAMKLSESEEAEVRAIRDRVSKQREPLRLYDYRFKYSDVITERARIGRQLKPDTFMLDGTDEAIKLSGIKLNKSSEKYEEAMKFLEEYMGEGKRVKLLVAEDTMKRKNNDILKTTKAVVYSNGVNINKELIKRGLAEEDKEDFSATGVYARFNSLQRAFGKAWENVAHFDSAANTKLLQVRSAAEDYERKHVYNKDFKEWQEPVRDFLKPFIWTNTKRTGGVLVGAAIGYMFGSPGSKYGKLLGAIAGASIIGGAKVYKKGYEIATGETWIPEEKRKERELNDYIDKLKFVKNRRLFEVYASKALKEDGIDVKQIIKENKEQGDYRKRKARGITAEKVKYKKTGKLNVSDFEDKGVEFDTKDKLPSVIRSLITGDGRDRVLETADKVKKRLFDSSDDYSLKEAISDIRDTVEDTNKRKERAIIKTVNSTINDNTNNRAAFDLSENAMKAIEYYNQSEKTMYGYDPGEELTNIMAALPKVERQYFRHFLEAPEKERKRILEIAPKYMRRALQSAYGMKVDEKENLASYFQEHYLPGEDWDGWQENFNLDAMKVKMVQTQGLEMGSFDLWEDDKIEADMYGPTAIPNMEYKTKDIQSVKDKMRKVLGDAGYSDLEFSFEFGSSQPSINLDMYQDRKDRYDQKLKERLGVI